MSQQSSPTLHMMSGNPSWSKSFKDDALSRLALPGAPMTVARVLQRLALPINLSIQGDEMGRFRSPHQPSVFGE